MEKGTLLFLHAYPLDGHLWDPQVESLAPGFRALAPSLPGFGGRPPGPDTLDGWVDEVLAMLDREGVGSFIPVGLSMGGYLAFRIVERVPWRIAGLVLCNTRASPDAPEVRERRLDLVRKAREEGIGWLADQSVPLLLSEETRKMRPTVESYVREATGRADPEGVDRALLAMRDRPDSRPLLPTIQVPVLCIAGAADALTPPSEMQEMATQIPRATLVTLAGAGHLSNREATEAFNQALREYLAALPG
ncbi:MAG TPA: alpha/beta fold hydrolase [Myxococcota bacterium]|nr:alpha/beta fold hydrolase [Myxococcota bacterium]HQK51432.1 alpha/beta fold hydrolase [Myxococcota bacterium]